MLIQDVVRPSDEVLTGSFDFTVQTDDQFADEKRIESDPELFFRKTYPTNDIRGILELLDGRLRSTEARVGTIVVRSPKGAGKSHVLRTAEKCLRHAEAASKWVLRWASSDAGQPLKFVPPQPAPIVILRNLTLQPTENLWDCIFDHPAIAFTGHKASVARLRQPGKAPIVDAIANRGTIVLMLDELEGWFATHPEKRAANIEFLKALTNVAAGSKQLTLILSVLGEDRALFDEITRENSIAYHLDDAEDQERVVLFRLFEDWEKRDKARIDAIIDRYTALYEEVPKVREAVRDIHELKKRMRATYPIHPMLLDRVIRRFPNRASELGLGIRRGIVFLTPVLRAAASTRDLILCEDVSILDTAIRTQINRLGLDAVRLAKVTDENLRNTPSTIERKTEVLSTILLYSLDQLGRAEATYGEVLLGTLRPEPPGLVNDVDAALRQLERYAANLHHPAEPGGPYKIDLPESPNARVEAEAQNLARYPDEVARELIVDEFRRLLGTEDVVFFGVDVADDRLNEGQLRDTAEWRRFSDERGRLDRDDGKLKVIVSLASLKKRNRFELLFYGATFRNLFALLEPTDPKFNLASNKGLAADLLAQARRVLACRHLCEPSVTPREKENRTRLAQYERIEREELNHLREALHASYARWVYWTRPQKPFDVEQKDVRPERRKSQQGLELTKTYFDKLIEQMNTTFYGRVYADRLKRLVAEDLKTPGSVPTQVIGRRVRDIETTWKKEVGYPPVALGRPIDGAIREIFEEREISVAEDGGVLYAAGTLPRSRLSEAKLLDAFIRAPVAEVAAEPATEQQAAVEGTFPIPANGSGAATATIVSTTRAVERRAVPKSVPAVVGRDAFVQEAERLMTGMRLMNLRIEVSSAQITGAAEVAELREKLKGRLPLGPGDSIELKVCYTLRGPHSAVELRGAIASLPDLPNATFFAEWEEAEA